MPWCIITANGMPENGPADGEIPTFLGQNVFEMIGTEMVGRL